MNKFNYFPSRLLLLIKLLLISNSIMGLSINNLQLLLLANLIPKVNFLFFLLSHFFSILTNPLL